MLVRKDKRNTINDYKNSLTKNKIKHMNNECHNEF